MKRQIGNAFFAGVLKGQGQATLLEISLLLVDALEPGAPPLGSVSRPIGKSGRERNFQIINEGYHEICESYERLRDIEVYLRAFPARAGCPRRFRFLCYHVENYLNEVYVLQCRMKSFAKRLARLCAHTRKGRAIDVFVRRLNAVVEKALTPIVEQRSQHVHNRRHTDPELARLRIALWMPWLVRTTRQKTSEALPRTVKA